MAPARRTRLVISFRGVPLVGSWSVLSISEDHRLPYLANEIREVKVDIVGFVRRGGLAVQWRDQ